MAARQPPGDSPEMQVGLVRPGGSFGIAARVLFVLLFACVAMLNGFLVVRSGFLEVGNGLADISERQVPALVASAGLIRVSYRLTTLGPELLVARSRLIHDELLEQARRDILEKERLVAALRATDYDRPAVDAIDRHFDALADRLLGLARITEARLERSRRMDELIFRLHRLAQRIEGAEGWSDAACGERWRARARLASVALLAVPGTRHQGQVQRLREEFERHAQGMRRSAGCIGSVAALSALHLELLEAGGDDGPFSLRLRQLEEHSRLEKQLGRVRYLGETLMTAVEALFRESEQTIREQSGTVQRISDTRLAVLGLIPVLLLLGTAGTWLYLNRALLRPIAQLRRALDDSLAEVPARFPVARRDEIGAIIESVRSTLETLRRRKQELRTAKLHAEHASSAKSLFLANMSHELRTPLNAVLGYADLLRRNPRLDEEARAQCTVIQRSGTHLLRLIEDLLDLASIEFGRLKPSRDQVDLHLLLDELERTTSAEARAKGLVFRVERGPELPTHVIGDARRLRQVLLNLLANAVKYTESGSVTLRAAVAGRGNEGVWLRFDVEDTGPGISAHEQERLFRPFEQLHPGQPGSGLGLAISRELALVLGGSLDLRSELGRGSRFRLEVTVMPYTPAPVRNLPEIIGYRGPRRRVLVVDDEIVNRTLLAHQLEDCGFIADTADGAASALVLVEEHAPDLVLMDLVMPQWCGYAATVALREHLARPGLPVVAVSATALEPADAARGLGFDGVVTKPVEREALLNVVGALLGLDWERAAEEAPHGRVREERGAYEGVDPTPTGASADVIAPPVLELDTALELAGCGQLDRVDDWCDDLVAGDPSLAPFADRVRECCAGGDAGRVVAWLRRYRH